MSMKNDILANEKMNKACDLLEKSFQLVLLEIEGMEFTDPVSAKAEMAKLAEIKVQIEYWRPEAARLFGEMMDAFHSGAKGRYRNLRSQYHTVVMRYRVEVLEKLMKMVKP